ADFHLANANASGRARCEYYFELQIEDRNLHVPILVVGTKADLVKQELTGGQRRYSIVDEYGLTCTTHFARGSIAVEKINAFFEKVIDKKFQSPAFEPIGKVQSDELDFSWFTLNDFFGSGRP
ncbi:1608_t:CDS:2, partial [Ambispora leptoticha]